MVENYIRIVVPVQIHRQQIALTLATVKRSHAHRRGWWLWLNFRVVLRLVGQSVLLPKPLLHKIALCVKFNHGKETAVAVKLI